MTVKELIEMLKTCDEESIVSIDYNGDINSINEVCDYSNNCGEVIIVSDELNVKAMTVKELIDKLQQFDEDKLVLVEDTEYKELKKFRRIADKIVALEDEYSKKNDEELANMTNVLKEMLENGKTINDEDVIVPAFATVREAAYRKIGEKPYYVQLLGGLALHYGNIAEMKTGEGKTLTTILPAYLNALTGKGVHVVTVNEYLTSRNAEWMGPIYNFLGLTVGVNLR